jgi:phosphopantothenoylcysteine decarboxylase/phosphopantothenate--cysteine ligase
MSESHEKRKVLLGISGSIAAYKSAEIIRLLTGRGYKVRVVMTKSAQKFITPLTMEALSHGPVVTDMWDDTNVRPLDHIALANWADVIVIAPATADLIAKLAAGHADSALTAICLASPAPLLVAPAMNVNMWKNAATQENVALLKGRGVDFIDPDSGALACGAKGAGRMADPWEIFWNIRCACTFHDLAGKKVVITTGPTREMIDPVRFLSNRSSGKMGVALAREAYRRGAEVHLIHGAVPIRVPRDVYCEKVVTAEEMLTAVQTAVFDDERRADVVIMAAAVADFRAKRISEQKIKRRDALQKIELEANPDILHELGTRRGAETAPILVGFAVETGELDDLMEETRRKMADKKADMIVGNFAAEALELDTNRVWIVDYTGRQAEVTTSYKSRVANNILDSLIKIM